MALPLRIFEERYRTMTSELLESGGVSSPTFSQDGLYLAFIQNGELKVYDWMLSEYVETEAYGDVTDCSFDRAEDDEQATHFLYFTSGPLYYGCDIFRLDVDAGVLFEVTDEGDASASAPVTSLSRISSRRTAYP